MHLFSWHIYIMKNIFNVCIIVKFVLEEEADSC